jgi:hypothetical protein
VPRSHEVSTTIAVAGGSYWHFINYWQRGSGLVNESLSVGPTRYCDVVLTSWDRGRSDCERDPSATRAVVLTSWDRDMNDRE